MSVASPVLGMRAMAAPMILQESSTYGINGDAFLVQGWDRTQPLTAPYPASQGLLFPIEAMSRGSQREMPTCPDSDSVGYDRLTCTSNLDRETDTSTLSSPLPLSSRDRKSTRQTENEAVKTSQHGMSPGVRSTPGIKDAAPALYNYMCSVLQSDKDPNITNPGRSVLPSETNPGHSVLPSEMAPRTNPASARLIKGQG